jgi:hypothetical protein
MQTPTKLTSADLYAQFKDSIEHFENGSWRIAIFEGSPEEGLYSWCPDCVVALPHIQSFERFAPKAKLMRFKVGSKDEWEASSGNNPFRFNFPYVSDVPTAILFMGKLDVYRVTAPREQDLRAMFERTKIYEDQIRSGDWHPPLRHKK